jgi:anti-anti-sigma factor
MVRHQLASIGRDYDFESLRSAVDAALNTNERSLTVDLDGVGFLDAAVVRELIRGLRRLRDRGGTMYVASTRGSIHTSLRALGLDRVFRTAAA